MKTSTNGSATFIAMILFVISTIATVTSFQVAGNSSPAFEVASFRRLPPGVIPDKTHPGLNIVGTRVDGYMQLSRLVATAYHLKEFQISGPDWLEVERFVIHAKIPDGATEDQVPEMLKSLLVDRLTLVAHWETRIRPVYALVVAKGGPKLQKAAQSDASPTSPGLNANGSSAENSLDSYKTADGQQTTVRQEGQYQRTTVKSVKTGGRAGTVRKTITNGTIRMELPKVTMDAFAEETLAEMVGDRAVLNQTNLKGFYQVTIELPYAEYLQYITRNPPRDPGVNSVPGPFVGRAAPAPTADSGTATSDPSSGVVFRAVQKLGLVLRSQKGPMKQLVIDHIEKNPTEN